MKVRQTEENKVIVENESLFTGAKHELTLNLSFDEFMTSFNRWNQGEPIQTAFSKLSRDEREFLLSGTTSEEWDEAFREEKEDV